MKAYKITVNVKFDGCEYIVSKIGSPKIDKRNWDICHLCRETYEEVIGKEVVGEVTFILRKIKGKATDYINPFRFSTNSLQIHDGEEWDYAKTREILSLAIDMKKLSKWAKKEMFSIETEY